MTKVHGRAALGDIANEVRTRRDSLRSSKGIPKDATLKVENTHTEEKCVLPTTQQTRNVKKNVKTKTSHARTLNASSKNSSVGKKPDNKIAKNLKRTSTTNHKDTNKRRRSSLKSSDNEQTFTQISNNSKRSSLANSSPIIHEVESLTIQSPTTNQKEIESQFTEISVKTSGSNNSTTTQHITSSDTINTESLFPKVLPPSISSQTTSVSSIIPNTETSTSLVPTEPSLPVSTSQAVVDVDSLQHNIYYMGHVAFGIFQYLKERETKFQLSPLFLEHQQEVDGDVRMILIDWLVMVQQNFSLLHECLYTGVKLVDIYLSRVQIPKKSIQLLGAVALNLAAKFEEQLPPYIDDYVYICCGAYDKKEFLEMEHKVLVVCDFELSIPLSYSFLRRYANCGGLTLETLTLARYYLETSLLHHQLSSHLESKMAAACLFIAMMVNEDKCWDATLKHYTGYQPQDIKDVILDVNKAVANTPQDIVAVKSKYSHEIFLSVALKRSLSDNELLASIDYQQ